MKLVKLTATEVEQFKKSLSAGKSPAPAFHQEELKVDDVAIALARLKESEDARTNSYSIGFTCGDSEYLFIVRPTVHEVPSITLNIIKRAGEAGPAEFASYSVLKDTVTTIKGQVSGMPKGQTREFDFAALLKYLKVQ